MSITITYSNIEGGWPGVGNMTVNPMFVDPDGDDDLPGTEDDNLRLLNWSPSVNVGDKSARGNSRKGPSHRLDPVAKYHYDVCVALFQEPGDARDAPP